MYFLQKGRKKRRKHPPPPTPKQNPNPKQTTKKVLISWASAINRACFCVFVLFLLSFAKPHPHPTPSILLWLWVSMAVMTWCWVTSPLIPVSLCVSLASTQVLFFVLFFATGLLKVCNFQWCWQASLDFEFDHCAGCLNHLQRMFTFSSVLAVFELLTLYSPCTLD